MKLLVINFLFLKPKHLSCRPTLYILNHIFFFNLTDKVSYSYKITGKVSFCIFQSSFQKATERQMRMDRMMVYSEFHLILMSSGMKF
jgi:hypothetical protein